MPLAPLRSGPISGGNVYAIGIDGGGTRTRAALVDKVGQVCGAAVAGCGNYQSLGLQGLEDRVAGLLEDLGMANPGGVSACLALAGAGRPDEQAAIVERLGLRWPEMQAVVVSDAQGALEGAHGGGPGLIAIAGTGSMVLGRDSGGRYRRAGGWGPVLGDQGSGYSLGLAGLRAVLQYRDGWGPATALEEPLRLALGLEGWEQLVACVYGGACDRSAIAALAQQVCQCARQGDAVARRLVDDAGGDLGAQIVAVARALGLGSEVEIACAGGLFKAGDLVWRGLAGAAEGMGIKLLRRSAKLPPVMGAVLIARRAAGYEPSPALLQALLEGASREALSP